ncbi:MAG: serine beta-lactamase-like protein LACTB [Kiritimatiellia bacterium]|jgi:serine beta-lactamase-like protein LACTB
MRALLVLAFTFAGCSKPQLQIVSDGQLLQSGHMAELGETRQFTIAPARLELVLSNVGGGVLDVVDLDLPPGVSVVRPDLPLELSPDKQVSIRLGLAAVDEGPIDGQVRVESNDLDESVFVLNVKGRVAPYIQIDLQDWPAVDERLAQQMEQDGLVGMAAAVVEGQNIVWMQGYGLADREGGVNVDAQVSRFRWASLSKGLTALVAANAVGAGDLDFDDEVSDLVMEYEVPELWLDDGCESVACAQQIPVQDRHVSLRQLLSHTAGAQHYSNGVASPEPPVLLRASPQTNTGMRWALDYWTNNPLVHIPGADYSYSTFGYNLAGVAIESSLDTTLPAAVQERVADPLGITTLGPDYAWDPAPDRVAHYDLVRGDAKRGLDSDVSWKLAGGGFESTVEDLARYCAGLMGQVVVDPIVRDADLWHRQAPATGYGLGFSITGDGAERRISHTGAQQGTRTALLIDPSRDRCYVFMTNSTWARPSTYTSILQSEAP